MPTILKGCLDSDVATRHGSILALAEIILSLSSHGTQFESAMNDQIRFVSSSFLLSTSPSPASSRLSVRHICLIIGIFDFWDVI